MTPESRPAGDFSDLMIPFGMRPGGVLVGASEPGLPNGLACGCVCPKCKARLVARNLGEHNRPHFAHEAAATSVASGNDEPSSCVGAKETSIHLMAKQVIANSFIMLLPNVVATMPPLKDRILCDTRSDLWHRLDRVRLEVWCDGFRPDIIASYAGHVRDGKSRPFAVIGEDVAIEIAVTHPCGPEKIDKLREKGLPAFEIDVSAERYSASEKAMREVINRAPRKWLFHPMTDKAEAEMKAEYAVWGVERQMARAEQVWHQQETVSKAARPPPPQPPVDAEEYLRVQIAGLRTYEPTAWKRYNFNDERERAAMEVLLAVPWPRAK